jgi:hypothetical protein
MFFVVAICFLPLPPLALAAPRPSPPLASGGGKEMIKNFVLVDQIVERSRVRLSQNSILVLASCAQGICGPGDPVSRSAFQIGFEDLDLNDLRFGSRL